ncbi:pyrroline-5-carboxylate reductase [Rhizoclosmatium globosum]|uniref:Pyrroline-5-carboxylate reductase n=1 Tax=Rhizoclosmatium globosum TaxID=329046 RepID=A0A1Y2CF07_9FUNG|nr:pyrroline-5-carboxylate reductase [Rhizoclosmatium globosum]|eukprot:ORY45609.1 pyrroline-5-carboxylate reductase [Rhizoclosmatium globosum]
MTLDRSTRIAFIGGGQMARAMIGGLTAAGHPTSNIFVAEPFQGALDAVSASFAGVSTSTDNTLAVNFNGLGAHVVVLAVKPQVLKGVAEGLANSLKTHKSVVVSIAAGIRIKDLARWLDWNTIVRVMPNTPALVNEGASGLYADESCTQQQKDLAFAIAGSFSKMAYWVEKEVLLDVVTGVSGSGPAYFFYLLEAMENAAVELGMPREVARGLAAQTCLGAGKMALAQLDTDPAILRKNVTSPKGTTEAGIKVFDDLNAKKIMQDVVIAATKRADELGDILGSQ